MKGSSTQWIPPCRRELQHLRAMWWAGLLIANAKVLLWASRRPIVFYLPSSLSNLATGPCGLRSRSLWRNLARQEWFVFDICHFQSCVESLQWLQSSPCARVPCQTGCLKRRSSASEAALYKPSPFHQWTPAHSVCTRVFHSAQTRLFAVLLWYCQLLSWSWDCW